MTAAALGWRALLYIGDHEEILGRGGAGRWPRIARQTAAWLEALAEAGEPMDSRMVSLFSALEHLPAMVVARKEAEDLIHGRKGFLAGTPDGVYRVRHLEDQLLAIVEVTNGKPDIKVFPPPGLAF